jgi:hypothetical protein
MASIIKILIFTVISFAVYWFFTKASPEQKGQATEMAKEMKDDLGTVTKEVFQKVTGKGKELYENREEIIGRAKEVGASLGEKVKETGSAASEKVQKVTESLSE